MDITRRDFIEETVGGFAAMNAMAGGGGAMQAMTFRTRLCDLLGIDYPVVQAPMQTVVTPQLVAAVCEAGGLGILPGIGVPPEELRRRIRETRALTKRPFGVNLILHSALRPPVDPAAVPAETVRAVNAVSTGFENVSAWLCDMNPRRVSRTRWRRRSTSSWTSASRCSAPGWGFRRLTWSGAVMRPA